MSQTMEAGEMEMARDLMEIVCRQACIVSIEQAHAVVNQINYIATVLPFTDPAAYRRIQNNIPDHERAMRAFLDFRLELEKLKPKEEK